MRISALMTPDLITARLPLGRGDVATLGRFLPHLMVPARPKPLICRGSETTRAGAHLALMDDGTQN
jgi:hypothetical protein